MLDTTEINRARAWRVQLEGEQIKIAIAPSRAEAIRIVRFDWAREHKRSFGASPECVLIRRCQ